MPIQATDLNLAPKDLSSLTTADAVAGFLATLGYDTAKRKVLTPEAIGLAGDSAAPIRLIEILAEDSEGFLRVVFVQLRSLTAKSRNDLARVLGRTNIDHLLVLTSDFETLEFVLLDKRRREIRGPAETQRIQVVPLSLAVARKAVDTRQLRAIRRFTWTSRDGLEQFDKLRSVFEAAAFSEDYFCNRALFADHYLLSRLREDAAWRDNPTAAFQQVKQLLANARGRWLHKGEQLVRDQLYEPLFKLLGFQTTVNKASGEAHTKPDYLLVGSGGKTAAFVYAWDRWLDGPDFNLDQQTPEENPGACVVTALDEGVADWIIMTNGRQWRLYSRHAHSRATNFYEVDLAEALVASGDTDPNEAFRYWWLFFRAAAFAPVAGQEQGCWLDAVAQGSRDYAKQLGERLKQRIFETIFPHLAQGFLEDRKRRMGIKRQPSDDDLRDAYEATLTLLYRLLFLLYAESRDLLPIREAPYHAASLTKVKEEIAEKAGIAETEVADRLARAYSASDTNLYDRSQRLCAAMDRGDPSLNVPIYNGGLFITHPGDSDSRDERIARFLVEHKVPDRYLASAIDRLARDPDDKTLSLVFIDYKSLEVRHLGSIYEGLLEFKLRVADEDLTTKTEKGKEKFIPLTAAKAKRGKAVEAVVRKGEVYLSNDKAERKASGSYYTPDPIVKYIVEHTVGPVLADNLEKLRGDLCKVRRTFDNELAKLKVPPAPEAVRNGTMTARDFAAGKTYEAHRELVEQLFDFRTLDPAMGSGHFLVEAVDFITDRLLTFLNQFPVNPVTFMLERTRKNILGALGEQGVSVDPDKLTEVNLLKRHVLKRCIYGVDLNPMAVELAKVSLWLDAFTIGAPLSFLDHHLRCGNSLIGATFQDLANATKGQLFGIDYDPLLRAIQHVLHVNKMADATAAEVKQSASEYGQAREELSGYQIVLDLLVARHFGFPKAAGLLEHGKDLDLTNRARFLKSLENLEELALVETVTALARQADRRFFHWEIEFPEVFFSFADSNQRQLNHKNEMAEGSAGFDAVVGNPPYDELSEHAAGRELPEKAYFKAEPQYKDSLGGRLNVFRPFILRSLAVLRNDGRHSFIVPMALLADQFTSALRRRLLLEGWLRSIAAFPQKDDPHNRVFFEAKLSTCVFVAEKRRDPECGIQIRTYPGKSFDDPHRSCIVTLDDIKTLDAIGLSLPTVDQTDIDRANVAYGYARTTRFENVAHSHPGEIMFNAAFEFCVKDAPPGDLILRGAHVGRYVLNDDPKQGEPKYLDRKKYLAAHVDGEKSQHYLRARVGYQRGSAVDNWRRIIATHIPAGHFCSDTVAYFVESKYDHFATLACFCSALAEWRFGLTSTNNHVNAYEVDAIPIARFARITDEDSTGGQVDWDRWDRILDRNESGIAEWTESVESEIVRTPSGSGYWLNSIHDGLAAAGKEMSRLGAERQTLCNQFSDWLVDRLGIDEEGFSGITRLRGGQADFDELGWDRFNELLHRNRRACRVDPGGHFSELQKRYLRDADTLTRNRTRFAALDAAIDRVVWQLVGLAPDGSIPKQLEEAATDGTA